MEQQYSTTQVQQSHDMRSLQQQPRRSSPRGESNNATVNHSGHIMQSRSSSQSHSVSKKSRSRSRGKRRPQQQQSSQHQQYQQQAVRHNDGMIGSSTSGRRTPQDFHDSNIKFSESESSHHLKRSSSLGNMSSSNIYIDDTKINEFGRCIRHPNIELCCRDTPQSPWRMLLQDCPLCSLDMDSQTQPTGSGSGGLSSLHDHQGNTNKFVNDGGNSSQPSTKTARTFTTEEDNSSVKSWTMSDASDVSSRSNKSSGNRRSSVVESEQLVNLARNHPPPPPKQMQGKNPYLQQQNQKYQLQQQRQQQNPVQSLKELGRKLVMESEVAAGAGDDVSMRSASTRNSRRPPPPPPRARGQQQPQQHRAGPPPRRRGRSASGGVDESNIGNNCVLGESDELLARMQSLTTQEGDGVDMTSEEERAAADKRARAQRRKEKAERKARKRQQQQEQQIMGQEGGRGRQIGTFEIPMNDIPTRGRDGRTDDILQAAAKIRARARRSTSRSRERVKEAAIFCGESLPVEDDTSEGGQLLLEDGRQQGKQLLLQDGRQEQRSRSEEKRRSILNPHGLEDQPRPLAVERRSQSRERRKKSSRGRRRSTRENGGLGQQQQTSAEELLSRRREMRQKIAERQSNAQSRIEHRRTSSGGRGRGGLADDDNDSLGWTRTQSTDIGSVASRRSSRRGREADDKSERSSRRGRSRSAVRDGLSKIRSASMNAFRNKKEIGIDLDDEENYTVDTGKRSTSSFKRMLSKKGKSKPRSLSGTRKEWGGISEPNIEHGSFNTSYGQGFESDLATTKSESFARQSSSSRFGMLKKSLTKKKPKGGGMVRSLSRGNFRDSDLQSAATFTEKWEERSGTSRSEMFPNVSAWEFSGSSQSMRSASSGRQRPRVHEFLDF